MPRLAPVTSTALSVIVLSVIVLSVIVDDMSAPRWGMVFTVEWTPQQPENWSNRQRPVPAPAGVHTGHGYPEEVP